MTHDQAIALLSAEPRRVPFFNGEQIIQCTACRHYFSNGTAWKVHRRTGNCDTDRLSQDAMGVWLPPRRIRLKTHNAGTTGTGNAVPDAPITDRLINNPAVEREPP